MDALLTNTLWLIGLAAVLGWVAWFVGRNFTQAGKERNAYREEKRNEKTALATQQAEEVARQKAIGIFRTPEKAKTNVVALVIIGWAFIGGIFTNFSMGGLVLGAIWGVIMGLISVAIARMAENKGRSFNSFFWLSVLINPILMWIIAAALSPLPGSVQFADSASNTLSTTSADAVSEIKKLGDLKDQGLITKAEFDAKKKELLDRI